VAVPAAAQHGGALLRQLALQGWQHWLPRPHCPAGLLLGAWPLAQQQQQAGWQWQVRQKQQRQQDAAGPELLVQALLLVLLSALLLQVQEVLFPCSSLHRAHQWCR
jgi:hypothetical protein